jgi:hypothetical protein
MERKNIYVIAGTVKETLIIRFVVCSRNCEMKDILFAWNEIQSQASAILKKVDDDMPVPLTNRNEIHGKIKITEKNGDCFPTKVNTCAGKMEKPDLKMELL